MADADVIARMVRNEADMAYRRRVQTILEWLNPQDGDRILDGGTGRGFYLRFVRAVSGAFLLGLELDPAIVRMAQAAVGSLPRVALARANLYAVPAADAAFDKAVLSEVLEHIPDDVRALREVRRVLRPGGLLAITVPNANYPFWWDPVNKTLETLFGTHIRRGVLAGIWANHVRLYTREQLRGAVLAAGLEIVEERAFTHYSFPFIHNIVYGFGKTALEAGVLPAGVAAAADRHDLSGARGGAFNPVNVGLRTFEWFDRRNVMNEPEGRATVNLCVLARRPPA